MDFLVGEERVKIDAGIAAGTDGAFGPPNPALRSPGDKTFPPAHTILKSVG